MTLMHQLYLMNVIYENFLKGHSVNNLALAAEILQSEQLN